MSLPLHFRRTAMAVAVTGMASAAGLYALHAGAAPQDGAASRHFSLFSWPARFAGLAPATTDGEKRQVRASDWAAIKGRPRKTGYVTILRSGEQRGADAAVNTFGQIVDDAGKPIVAADGSTMISDANDFSSLLKVGSKLFAVSQFENQPGGMYLTELSQDAVTGQLSALSTTALDLSDINGIWNPCAGMVTPWNTHLGSEEYEPDAKKGAASAASMAVFFGGGTTVGGDASKVKPYYWGFPVEVAVTGEDGSYEVSKHYSMGRFAHELSYVMPDRKTVYQSDDGTNVGLFMYVADQAGALDSGTLYASKWSQTSAAGASDLIAGDIGWIKLGHASDSEIKSLIDGGITFADIFDTASLDGNGACPVGFKAVNVNGAGVECLALKAGMDKAAAFLETRRYAGYMGATTELRKEEGITFDPDHQRLYVSYSEIQYGMEDNAKNGTPKTTYDAGTGNDVKALFNSCGGVYGFEVGFDGAVGSRYVLKSVQGVVAGHMTALADPAGLNPSTIAAYGEDSPFAGSTCDIDGLANPDNISYMPGQNTLLIGEDTGDGHQNDAVWAFNVGDGKLTRIATTPYGSETTSLYYYPQINRFGYIVTVVQHPYGESDQSKVSSDSAERRSYFGYIGPLAPSR